MKKNFLKRIIALFIVISMLIQGIPIIKNTVNADEPISVGVNVANKIDVALAIGPTTVDYSTFETDLRALLDAKDPPVLYEDLYITAAKAVSANTTSEFSWWAYDHTIQNPAASTKLRPNRSDSNHNGQAFNSATYYATYAAYYDYLIAQANLGAAKQWNSATAPSVAELEQFRGITAPYSEISDATHTYIEYNHASAAQTGNGAAANNKDKTSPDYNTTRHPYDGRLYHMVESDNGATMDFYGYGQYSYKDFRYLPNDQATKKVFEFAIEEDVAYDALDGVGFFFNTDITGSYEAKTQTMSGYLLFLQYSTSGTLGKGLSMNIYKFKDVNTYRFHQSLSSATATTPTGYTVASYTEGSGAKFVKVAESSIYNATDVYRRIKLEVYPTYVKVYYNGSPTNASVLTTPIAEEASPVNFTGGMAGTEIPLDLSYVSSYGFGPMASYVGHTCARPTHIAMQNLSMVVDKVRTLVEVVREPEWADNTIKFLVNLNEQPVEDFSSTSITGELLNRLRNDDIYYIGWCNNINAVESAEFLVKNNLKGTIVNMEQPGTSTYEQQMEAIADEIYKRYWRSNNDNIVLTTDQVVLTVSGAEQTESADLEWPNGKWRVVHRISGDEGVVDNDTGIHPLSNQYLSDLDIMFNKPGYYDIYYRDQYLKTIIAHRPPVCSFDVKLNGDIPTLTNTSYDPDDIAAGIVRAEWSFMDLDTDSMLSPGQPGSLIDGHTYLVVLEVEDKYGEIVSISKQIRYIAGLDPEDPDEEEVEAPFSEFNISPNSILKGVGSQNITLTNTSYDLQGLDISSTFTLTKDGLPVVFSFTEGVNDVSILPVGDYVITLVVNNGVKNSVPFTRSFSIVEDIIPPTAMATETTGSYSKNTPITITFSDLGGSGFREQRVIVTESSSMPSFTDSRWTLQSSSSSRLVTINTVGTTYIHWQAIDYAGNIASGTFGPYTLLKQNTSITLSATPVTSTVYPSPIILTAVFEHDTDPTGTVFFQINGFTVGSATIAHGEASYTYNPLSSYIGDVTFKAVYNGDTNYNPTNDDISYTIIKNTTANVIVGIQTDKTYDGEPFEPAVFTVEGTNLYKVEFVGRDGMVYNSLTPPTDAGKYTMIVTTTDPGYEEKSDSANFEIFKSDQETLVITGLDSEYEIEVGKTITLGTTGGNGTGAVTYVSSDPEVASIVGNIITIHKIGEFTVTATKAGDNNYNQVSSSPEEVEIIDYAIDIILIPPDKLTYYYNEELVLTDGSVQKIMASGATVEPVSLASLPATDITGYDKEQIGGQTVYVEYAGITKSFGVTVSDKITGIEIVTKPEVTYKYGEGLSVAGGEIRVIRLTGPDTSIPMTLSMVSGYDPETLGEQIITVTHLGETTTYKVTVNDFAKDIIVTPPTKRVYELNETITLEKLAGGKVNVKMASGAVGADISLTPAMITSVFDSSTEGVKNITVEYGGFTKTDEFTFTVVDALIGIVVYPSKTEYLYNEALDTTGGKIFVIKQSGGTEIIDITPDMVTGYDKKKLGAQILSISYEGLTCEGYGVNVSDYQVGIVVTNPDKTIYEYGEDLELVGGKVSRLMASGAIKDTVSLAGYMVSGYDKNKEGEEDLTVEYYGYKTTYPVTVVDSLVGIMMGKLPKVSYRYGEELNLTGATVILIKTSGQYEVPLTADMLSGYNNSKVGRQPLTVANSGYETNFIVSVSQRTYTGNGSGNSVSDEAGEDGIDSEEDPEEIIDEEDIIGIVNNKNTRGNSDDSDMGSVITKGNIGKINIYAASAIILIGLLLLWLFLVPLRKKNVLIYNESEELLGKERITENKPELNLNKYEKYANGANIEVVLKKSISKKLRDKEVVIEFNGHKADYKVDYAYRDVKIVLNNG